MQRPTCSITFGNIDIPALLDSGSEATIISLQALDKLPKEAIVKKENKNSMKLRGATGHCLKQKGTCTLKGQIGPAKFQHEFNIVDGLSKDIILGSDFLIKTKSSIDFHKKTLKIGRHVRLLDNVISDKSHSLVQLIESIKVPAHTCMMVPVQLVSDLPKGEQFCLGK